MSKRNTILTWLSRLFYGFSILIFLWFTISGFVSALGKKNLIILSFIIFALFLSVSLWILYHFHARITNRCFAVLAVICMLLMAIVQYKVVDLLAVDPGWDFGAVFYSAAEYVHTGELSSYPDYFTQFPNNNGLLILEILYFKFLTFFGIQTYDGFLYGAIVLNCIVIDLSVLVTALLLRNLHGNAAGVFTLILCGLFTPFYLYAPIFYTDSMTLLFCPLSVALLLGAEHTDSPVKHCLLVFLLGILISLGTKTKGNLAVLLVAAIIYFFLRFSCKRALASVLIVLCSFGLFAAAFQQVVDEMEVVQPDLVDRVKMPTEYWIYMGLNSPGGFHQEDFDYIRQYPTLEERKEAGSEGISDRIHEYGLKGMLVHISQKAGYTLGDGAYYIWVQLERNPRKYVMLSQYLYPNMPKNYYYLSIANGYHFLLLLLMILGLFPRLVHPERFSSLDFCYLTLLGVLLFLMIWETRSRYLLNCVPLMLILAADFCFRFITPPTPSVPISSEKDYHHE